MAAEFTCSTAAFNKAVTDYQKAKGYTLAKACNKAMGTWTIFASNKIKTQSRVQNAGDIRGILTGQAERASSGRNKRLDVLRGSLAAAIIAARLRRQGRFVQQSPLRTLSKTKDKEERAAIHEFYDKVQRFISARARGAGYLRSGFIPAFQSLGVPRPRGTRPMKSSGHSFAKPAQPALLESFVRNARKGAATRFSHVFKQSEPEVIAQLKKWTDEAIMKAAQKSGFAHH